MKRGPMRKDRLEKEYTERSDIPKNIVVLVMFIAIIVSITGTWMVLDAASNSGAPAANTITARQNIALNIEYEQQKNETGAAENG